MVSFTWLKKNYRQSEDYLYFNLNLEIFENFAKCLYFWSILNPPFKPHSRITWGSFRVKETEKQKTKKIGIITLLLLLSRFAETARKAFLKCLH